MTTLHFRRKKICDCCRVLARAVDFSNGILFYRGSLRSHGRRSRGLRYSGAITNPNHVSPPPPFPPSLRLKKTKARGLPCLCADEADNIYSACSSAKRITSPRREANAQHTPTLLELELIQTHMTQKPMLRVEVSAVTCSRCACAAHTAQCGLVWICYLGNHFFLYRSSI
jgi:hypothetical protein